MFRILVITAAVLITATAHRPYSAFGQGQTVLRGHNGAVVSLAFSPDGKFLASGSVDLSARVWNVASGEQHLLLNAGKVTFGIRENRHYVEHVAFSPDGKKLATVAWDAKIWDVQTGKELATVDLDTMVSAVAFSPDSKLLAEGGWGARLWEADTGKLHAVLIPGFPHHVDFVTFDPSGKTVVTAGSAQVNFSHIPELQAWDVNLKTNRAAFDGHQMWITSIALTPNGKLLAAASWLHGENVSTVKVFDYQSAKTVATLSMPGSRGGLVAFSPNAKTLATLEVECLVRLWSTSNWQQRAELQPTRGKDETTSYFHPGALVFSPDSQRIAIMYERLGWTNESASYYEVLTLWDTSTGKKLTDVDLDRCRSSFSRKRGTKLPVAFSPDGTCIAVAGESGLVRIIDVSYFEKIAPD